MTYAISGEGLLALQTTAFRNPSVRPKPSKDAITLLPRHSQRRSSSRIFREATLEQLQSSGPESGRDSDSETEAAARRTVRSGAEPNLHRSRKYRAAGSSFATDCVGNCFSRARAHSGANRYGTNYPGGGRAAASMVSSGWRLRKHHLMF